MPRNLVKHILFKINLLVLIVMLLPLSGMTQELKFTNFGIEHGLPSSEVYSVIQDQQGYIWGSTDAGIFKYNGIEFKVYTVKDGLPHTTIFHLTEDSQGRIWMAGINNKIAYIQDNRIVQVAANKQLAEYLKLPASIITCIREDSNGDILLGSNVFPIRITANGNYSDAFAMEFSDPAVSVSISGNQPGLLLTSNNGLQTTPYSWLLSIQTATIKQQVRLPPALKSKSINSFLRACMTTDQTVYFSFGRILGMLRANSSPFFQPTEHLTSFINCDTDNGVWVGTYSGGLYYYPDGDLQKKPFVFLKGLTPTGITQDYEGGIWISTIERGLYYAPSKYAFHYNSTPPINTAVNGLHRLNDNMVIGTTTEGNYFQCNHDGEIVQLTNNPTHGFREFTRFAIFEGQISVSGYNAGTLHPDLSYATLFKDHYGRPISGTDIVQYDKRTHWMCSDAFLYELIDGRIASSISFPARCNVIYLDREQDLLWIGTHKGLYTIHLTSPDRAVKIVKHPILNTDKITALRAFPDGQLIVATKSNGLFIAPSGKTEPWIRIQQKDALATDECRALAVQDHRHLWVATTQGISQIAFSDEKHGAYRINNINLSNGLISNEINALAIVGNTLWIASKKGIQYLQLDKILSHVTPPKVVVSEMMLNGTELSALDALEFRHDQNTFRLKIDVLSFKTPGKKAYYYRLSGRDVHLKRGNSDYLELQNLDPGLYTLEIFGVNSNGLLSRNPLKYSFRILPPFWSTWWFITLMALAFVTSGFLLFRWRLSISNRKQEEKNRYRQQLSNYQLTALRAQMNPHFIFNAFNGIQRYVLQKDKFETYQYITKFSQLIRDVLEESSNDHIPLEKEIEMICRYVEIEQLRFENGFDFQLDLQLEEDDLTLEIPGMLLQPLLENAIWHGIMPLQNRRGRLHVVIAGNEDYLSISVTDNGIGRAASDQIKKDVKHNSFGTRLLFDRIQLMNENMTNQRITIEFIDLMDAESASMGTQVILNIHFFNR